MPSPRLSTSPESGVKQVGERQECGSTDETGVSLDTPSSEAQESPRAPPEAAPLPEWDAVERSPGRRLFKDVQSRQEADSRSGCQVEPCCPSGSQGSASSQRSCRCHARTSCSIRGSCSSEQTGRQPGGQADGVLCSATHSCCGHGCRAGCAAHFPKWQKILWKKQPHPDCYVDETFLNSLMRNANLTRYIYADLCKSTVVLTQHLSCILIFLLIYRMIVKKSIEASTLVTFDIIALPLGYALRWSLRPAPRGARQVLQSAVIVFGVLRILAPVLQTLTQSFSDDTVISLTSMCLLIHIPFNDYSYVYRNPNTIDEPLGRLMSLNVALFANVLLASRLSTSTEVFAFLFFGIEVFALSPMARRYLLLWNPWACTFVATPLLILVTSGLVYIEGSASNVALYLFLMFFITFVGPYWLIKSQKYKNLRIRGPEPTGIHRQRKPKIPAPKGIRVQHRRKHVWRGFAPLLEFLQQGTDCSSARLFSFLEFHSDQGVVDAKAHGAAGNGQQEQHT
ncbi:hypothetical protein Efla_005250 [Eimeria flavescens]